VLADEDRTFKGYFSSFESACEFETRYLTFNNKQPSLIEDPTKEYPADVEGQKALVKRLYAAIFDWTDIIDNKRLNKVLNAQEARTSTPADWNNSQITRVLGCSSAEGELLAWKFLQATKDAQDGRLHIGKWSEDFKYRAYPSFMDRFVDVENMLKVSPIPPLPEQQARSIPCLVQHAFRRASEARGCRR
jgi:hypothetical protein